MKALVTLLHACANRRESATTLALFRILLCASALYSLAIMHRADVFDVTWVRAKEGGIIALGSHHWMFAALGGFNAASAHQLHWITEVALACGLLGFGGRATLLLAQQSYVALRTVNENSSGGYDSLICLGLLVLACSASTATLSLDCRLTYGRVWRSCRVAAWPRAVLVFQVLLMYSMTGLQKIGHSWTPMGGYTALHYVLSDPTWLRWDLGTLPWAIDPILRVATAVTWHWEQLSLLLLFHWYYRVTNAHSPRWLRMLFLRWDMRYPWTLVGVVMHVGILVLLDVGPFSLVSLAYYVNLWSPNEWHQVYNWARRLTARTRTLTTTAQP